jgi:thiosulfate/3-mercaptopyruvate sulfurtransferase
MSKYAHPEVLVDTQWLEDNLNNPNVRIVEVDASSKPYKDAHIPGAIFWNFMTDLLQPNFSMNLEVTAIEKLLSQSGITNDTTVIAYGSYPGTGAWIFWLLKLFGHDNVRVLNGGHQKWVAEGRRVTSDLSTFAATQYRAKTPDSSLRVLYEEVRSSIGQKERVLLDVRTPQEFKGEVFMMKPPEETERAGHIPGAVHIEHIQMLNEDGTFKSFNELQTLLNNKGVTPDKEIFPYCAIGGRSAYTWFILKYLLGFPNVRNYDGSWNEWSQHPESPVQK